MGVFNIDWRSNAWALAYCGVSTFGALCYGYDQIYYTGLLGMRPFIDDYGTATDSKGLKALTTSFMSLTASIIYVGELVGALLAAPINDRWGRKAVFYFASSCIIAGAIVQLTAHGIEGLIILGRILIGLGVGQFTVTCLLYIGEVAPLAIRGPALMMFQFMQSCSQLVGSGITQGTEAIPNKNAYLIPMGLLILLPGLMIMALPFTPESPTWYATKGRLPEAEIALRKINKSHRDYQPAYDIQVLDEAVKREAAYAADSTWISLLRDPIERRKLIYSCGAMVAQQINGIQFFYSYGVVFAQSIGIKEAFTISLITNILQANPDKPRSSLDPVIRTFSMRNGDESLGRLYYRLHYIIECDILTEVDGIPSDKTFEVLTKTNDESMSGFLESHLWLRSHLNKVLQYLYSTSKAYAQPHELADLDMEYTVRPPDTQALRSDQAPWILESCRDCIEGATLFVHFSCISMDSQSSKMERSYRSWCDIQLLFAAYLVLVQVKSVPALVPIFRVLGDMENLLDQAERMFELFPIDSLKIRKSLEVLRSQRQNLDAASPVYSHGSV
ncbi:Hexose transporter HXT13 [Colletotrichum sp. SAR 10_99]|nr:Hexose transporter HXT13 [Colletotrichum sp. SAR 10_96]KAJ5009019.1 Hexose transporter HXT13 [Colletotrichum sp. SAR 10_99]